MTRILVVGAGDPDDATFIHDKLHEVNDTYGPVTCVIHANHPQAITWQQAVSKQQRTLHKPILMEPSDGFEAGKRWRARLFDEGRPNYVVVFDMIQKRFQKQQIQKITFMATRRDIPVLTFSKDKKPVAEAAE